MDDFWKVILGYWLTVQLYFMSISSYGLFINFRLIMVLSENPFFKVQTHIAYVMYYITSGLSLISLLWSFSKTWEYINEVGKNTIWRYVKE